MTGWHGRVAAGLALVGAVVLAITGSAESAAPLFAVALVEASAAAYARLTRKARTESPSS